jgi:hypothetical protein
MKAGRGSGPIQKIFDACEKVRPLPPRRRNREGECRLLWEQKDPAMPKPPKTTPHSDIDGVHQDERPNVDSANAAGQDSGDLEEAGRKSTARPPYSDDGKNRDDRTG